MRGGDSWNMTSTCVQGGLPRPLGGYQPSVMMEAHSPAPAWHMHHPMVMKQEPIEEERNDSGINSGSDFHSSSPGSDNSHDFNTAYSSPSVSTSHPPYYSTPTSHQYTSTPVPSSFNTTPLTSQYNPLQYPPISSYPLGFNPLTPPSSEPMASPKNTTVTKTEEQEDNNTTLTPQNSPISHEKSGEGEDPLRRLQMALEKNGFLPPVSPKTTSEHSNDDDNKSDTNLEEDDENLRVPKMNSHGKVKTFKCKQCNFSAITKLDFWEHSKAHIKSEKMLICPKCPFVTEYKHHLEYHLRNHFGSKPFKCDKCNYSCVNKSMLNSHMKSHSNVYQYRCANCNYATKYCHSLKLHLRKYDHKPAMVLNPDGSPNPLPIIDVYGTRRGPKLKTQQSREEDLQLQQNNLAQLMMASSGQLPLPFPYPLMNGFPGPLANPLFFPQLAKLVSERKMATEELEEEEEEETEEALDVNEETPMRETEEKEEICALDLSKQETPVKNRRKGRAFKIERSTINEDKSDDDEEEEQATFNDQVKKEDVNEGAININNNNVNKAFSCQFCCISFQDIILYTMHMGYHGFNDPFTCNMCGEQCTDKVAFFLHIARNPHL